MIKGFLFYLFGLVVAMGAVGGIEHSVSNTQLAQASIIALVGCALMLVGVSYVKENSYE